MGLVDVYIASMYRYGHLADTVNSLLKLSEVATITAVCNNYTDEQIKEVEQRIDDLQKVKLIRGKNEKGCSEKLRYIGQGSARYIATCDDDLIYPKEYFKTLIWAVEVVGGIVSHHGRLLRNGKATNYYKHKRRMFHCLHDVKKTEKADVIGSGVALWSRQLFYKPENLYQMIKHPNMTDLYLSAFARLKDIPLHVVAHRPNWIKAQDLPKEETIFGQEQNNCEIQTRFINEIFL